mgnify:CR=1 FL=1
MQNRFGKVGRLVALMAVAGIGLGAFGANANIIFVGADESGSGDFANPAHWNNGELPATSATVYWSLPGTATASEKFVASILWAGAANSSYRFEDGYFNINTIYLGRGSSATEVKTNDVFEVGKGATLYSGNKIVVGGYSKAPTTGANGQHLMKILDGGLVRPNYGFDLGADALSRSNRLVICEGGVMDITRVGNGFSTHSFGAGSSFNQTDVYGQCISTQNYEYVYVGTAATSCSNVFTVHKGGYFQTKGNIFMGGKGSFNKIVVEEGGTFIQNNSGQRTVNLGYEAGSNSNLFYVASGATYSTAPGLSVGTSGSFNRAEFVNPASVYSAKVGVNASACHNILWMHGTNTIVSANLSNIAFGSGSNNVAILEGMVLTNATANFTLSSGYDCKLILTNVTLFSGGQISSGTGFENELVIDNSRWDHLIKSHARVYLGRGNRWTFQNGTVANFVKDSFNFGYSDADARNLIRVLSGAVLTFGDLRFLKDCNVMSISNATVNVQSGIIMPYTNGGGFTAATTNNTFRFEGDSPRLVGAGSIELRENYVNDVLNFGGMQFDFDLPEKPYEVAPITAKSLTLCASTRIHASVATKCRNRRRYVLAETSTGTISANLETLGAELPAGYRLSRSADKKQLVLSVPSDGGMLLLVR